MKKKEMERYLEEMFLWPTARLWNDLTNIPREIKWFFQRGIRGWADCDAWSLDRYLSSWLPQALERLKQNKHGYPCNLTEKKWNRILDQITESFKTDYKIQEHEYESQEDYKRLDKIRRRGLELFVEHYNNLWD